MNETEYENTGFFVREDGQRHPPHHPQTVFSGREDPDKLGKTVQLL